MTVRPELLNTKPYSACKSYLHRSNRSNRIQMALTSELDHRPQSVLDCQVCQRRQGRQTNGQKESDPQILHQDRIQIRSPRERCPLRSLDQHQTDLVFRFVKHRLKGSDRTRDRSCQSGQRISEQCSTLTIEPLGMENNNQLSQDFVDKAIDAKAGIYPL